MEARVLWTPRFWVMVTESRAETQTDTVGAVSFSCSRVLGERKSQDSIVQVAEGAHPWLDTHGDANCRAKEGPRDSGQAWTRVVEVVPDVPGNMMCLLDSL